MRYRLFLVQNTLKQLQKSTVFEWTTLNMKPTQTASRRDVMRAPTPTLDELEMYITTLNVGQVSHPPHQHPEEELLIVKEGTVETLQNGKGEPARAGVDHLPFLERPAQHPQRRHDAGHLSRDPVESPWRGKVITSGSSFRSPSGLSRGGSGLTRALRHDGGLTLAPHPRPVTRK
jgi:hypothetical protein